MGDAYTHEMGMTNPLVPDDEVTGCGANFLKPEIDALPLQTVDTFMAALDPAVPDASCTSSAGATTFATVGCASCHTPSLPGPGRTINLYSDLLVHDMGPGLADQFVAGSASGSEWRTAPLWRASERVHFLHDGRATSVADAIAAHGGQACRRRGRLCRARSGVAASAARVPRLYLRFGGTPPTVRDHWRWRSAASLL